jgi:hypothetical protein
LKRSILPPVGSAAMTVVRGEIAIFVPKMAADDECKRRRLFLVCLSSSTKTRYR